MSKPKLFLTRKWPRKAEEALGEIFDVTFNKNDTRLSKIEIAKAFAIHDAIAPTFGDNIDKSLIEKGLMSADEIAWLNEYHSECRQKIREYLEPDEKVWLDQ